METQHTVRARTRKRCDDGSFYCRGWIEPGEDYLRAVAFPGSDQCGSDTRPRVMNVCASCCTQVGHAPRMHRRRRR